MKVAFILPSLANRGPIVFSKYLIDELKNTVDLIDVFYFDDIVNIEMRVECKKITFWKKYDFSKYDIIHTTMARSDIYAWLYVPHNKWVVSMHNYLDTDLKMLYSKFKAFVFSSIWKMSLMQAQNIIVSSCAMRLYYEKMLGKNRNYVVIPYGITEKPYEPINESDRIVCADFKSKGYTVLGSVGLLIYRKGFHQILEFMKNNSKFACIIVGEGNQRKYLEGMAQEYNLQDRILLTGFRNSSYNYYQYIDIYMHVSYSEGFGLAMLEAMSKKLPIVCSALPIYADYFSEKDVAFFDVDTISSLSEAILKVVNNKDYYADMAYKSFQINFESTIMAKKHLDYYHSIKYGKFFSFPFSL
ncbi:hypothetical protein FACS189461_0990 [Spirochaetia bacterium]|nr:hypothetical protein FACS189461_0990 [Spirochaetia bacterium]